MPRTEVVIAMKLSQLKGRLIGGCGPEGRCRASQPWMESAVWGLEMLVSEANM